MMFLKLLLNLLQKKKSKDYDFLIVDFHGEITSEKMAIGNLFDGYATLVVGTHTHVPTNDARVLKMELAILLMLECVATMTR